MSVQIALTLTTLVIAVGAAIGTWWLQRIGRLGPDQDDQDDQDD